MNQKFIQTHWHIQQQQNNVRNTTEGKELVGAVTDKTMQKKKNNKKDQKLRLKR